MHTLRHSAASALIASGAHIKIVQELLGHSTYGITADVYAHVAIERSNARQRSTSARRSLVSPSLVSLKGVRT